MSQADETGEERAPGPGPEPSSPDGIVWRISLEKAPTERSPAWSRAWSLTHAHLRRRLPLAVVAAAALVGVVGYMTLRTIQAGALERRVAGLEAEREQLQALAALLEEVEEGYERLRRLFTPAGGDVGALWLPPAGISAPGTPPRPAAGWAGQAGASGPPSLWPLTERGFLTQGLIASPMADEASATHPGIDIAVPSGSYIRAIADGTVVERGEDPVYGLFVVVDHGGGYRSLYAHASVLTAEPGREVLAGEVLGLTGSSGQSSAPHLHLEITLDGEHVDPLSLLRRP